MVHALLKYLWKSFRPCNKTKGPWWFTWHLDMSGVGIGQDETTNQTCFLQLTSCCACVQADVLGGFGSPGAEICLVFRFRSIFNFLGMVISNKFGKSWKSKNPSFFQIHHPNHVPSIWNDSNDYMGATAVGSSPFWMMPVPVHCGAQLLDPHCRAGWEAIDSLYHMLLQTIYTYQYISILSYNIIS